MSLALTRKLAVVLGLVLLAPTALRAEFQTLWLIGGEDNPAQFSFNLRHGFSPANDINDPPPGKVTRLPGDPLFDPVFDELNRRNAVVFIHPTHCEAPEHTRLHAPPFVVEYVFDTTRALEFGAVK